VIFLIELFTVNIWLFLLIAFLGGCVGWGVHGLYVRRYLKKHMPEHPEYKIMLETLQKKEN